MNTNSINSQNSVQENWGIATSEGSDGQATVTDAEIDLIVNAAQERGVSSFTMDDVDKIVRTTFAGPEYLTQSDRAFALHRQATRLKDVVSEILNKQCPFRTIWAELREIKNLF